MRSTITLEGKVAVITGASRGIGEAIARTFLTPMKRYGQPDEIAGAALYLASDSASYLTGQAIVIDGGMTIA